MFKTFHLRVGNSGEESLGLDFLLRPTPAAQKWATCLQRAERTSFISQRQRWYNFPLQEKSNESFIVSRIDAGIQALNGRYPGLVPVTFDPAHGADSVNKIHVLFVEGAGNAALDEAAKQTWSEINYWLHAYESCVRSREGELTSGIPEANIVVNWADPCREPLAPEDYAHFTVAKKFGTCYLSYCQAGLHLYEMFLEQNEVVPDAQILPLRFASADTYLWFGSTTGPRSLEAKNAAIETWFRSHEKRFRALGLHWGDPALAIGWLPVADLTPARVGLEAQLELVNRLARMHIVLGATVS